MESVSLFYFTFSSEEKDMTEKNVPQELHLGLFKFSFHMDITRAFMLELII